MQSYWLKVTQKPRWQQNSCFIKKKKSSKYWYSHPVNSSYSNQWNRTTAIFPRVVFVFITITSIKKCWLDVYLREDIMLGRCPCPNQDWRNRLTLIRPWCGERWNKHRCGWEAWVPRSGGSHLVTTVFTRLHSSWLPQNVAGTENTIFPSSACFIISRDGVSIKGAVWNGQFAHLPHFSTTSVPAVAMAAVAATASIFCTKQSTRPGPAGKLVQTGVCMHTHNTPYTPFSTPKKCRGIRKKRKEAANTGVRAPLALLEALRRALESSCTTRWQAIDSMPSCSSSLSRPRQTDLLWSGVVRRPSRPCLVPVAPALGEQPMRVRPCPDPCLASQPGACWFQVQAQPFPLIWATLAFH